MNRIFPRACAAALVGLLALGGLAASAVTTTTTLADQPIFSTVNVPGNLALVMSVEYPTAISVANLGDYADANVYPGYFDPAKCYNYSYNSTTPSKSYFVPAAFGTGTYGHQCSGMWSGNFMNWATMQTIDPFRWAMTGGYRDEDDSITVLEKAWGSFQGGWNLYQTSYSNSTSFPYRGTSQTSDPNTGNDLPSNLISKVTPFSTWGSFNSAIWGNGNTMIFSGGTASSPATGYYTAYGTASGQSHTPAQSGTANGSVYDLQNDLSGANIANQTVTFRVYIRVQVCNSGTVGGVSLLEANCVQHGNYWKPEGLMQQYSNQMRYAAFSYLNGNGQTQQGGVLREPMGFIGPTYPQPLSTTVITNTRPEWSAATGIQSTNPDPTSASASSVSWSGAINYLNKFGEYTAKNTNAGNYTNNTNTYMTNDNVSELYYAAIRYFENLGNVSQWSTPQSASSTIELDGFPALTTWTDPIAYSCQKNFILGIGDDHTHFDYNVPNNSGATDPNITRPIPTFSDTLSQSASWTQALETLEGMSSNLFWQYAGGSYSTYFIAGLAYGAHVTDIRPDNSSYPQTSGMQTISTYWMDVEEYGYPEYRNPYYLATKYGGFTVPSGYSISNTTALPTSEWDTSGNTIQMGSQLNYTQNQPDNYFLAGKASQMVSGLTSAFSNISNAVSSFGSAFSLSASNFTSAGSTSFGSQYNTGNWTDVITASTLSYDSSGNPVLTTLWTSSATLQTQLANSGWQNSRNVATWSGTAGIPFEVANLSSSQLTALIPSYATSTGSTKYLQYLRGDQTNEVGSSATNGTKALRTRTLLLGDIVDANLTQVSSPNQTFSDANNPGYPAFANTWTNRQSMVYAAANDGMLHAFVGSSGTEQFAYVPSALFQGPTGTPQVNGLAALGNPNFTHHYYVDATPIAYDVDFNRTYGNMTTTSAGTSDWHTLLVGGLGKGGTSFYAIDVTNPASMTSESTVAGDVKWEYSDSTMGYSYGAPVVVKTASCGWVVAVTSGYDSSSSLGYIYLINPKTGALIQKIATSSASSGLTQASAYVQDYTDYTADSIYVGDLNGQLWRFDLTGTCGSYPAASQIATLTDSSGNAQPITTAPLIEIHPTTRKRYVMVGTGQFLSIQDVASSNVQSFYVIMDGTAGAFNPAPSTPITRTSLQAVTASNLTAGITLSSTKLGWYIDLGVDSASGIAWRVNVNPTAYNGTVSFAALLTTGSACNLSGQSEVYAVNYATATSILTSAPLGYAVFTSAVVNLKYVGVNGQAELVAGFADGSVYKVPANLTTTISTRLLNWREIPSAE